MSESNYQADDVLNAEFSENGGATAVVDRSHHKHAHRKSRLDGGEIPSVSFACLPSHVSSSAVKLVSALGLAALGGFLISEIPHTPALTTNLVVLGALTLLGGTALVVLAVRDTLGRLTVDDEGIAFSPSPLGGKLAWSNVTAWRLSDDGEENAAYRQLMFWTGKGKFPVLFDVAWLNDESLAALRKVLHARLGDES